MLTVARTLSSGEIAEVGNTAGSIRQVPLSRRALEALEGLPPRLDTRLLFPAKRGGTLNLDNWRRREWAGALAAGVSIFEIARIAGTSVRMIERHYGALLDGAGAGIASRLDAFDAQREQEEDRAEEV